MNVGGAVASDRPVLAVVNPDLETQKAFLCVANTAIRFMSNLCRLVEKVTESLV